MTDSNQPNVSNDQGLGAWAKFFVVLSIAVLAYFGYQGTFSSPVPTPTPTPTPMVTASPAPNPQVFNASLEGPEKPTPEKNYTLHLGTTLTATIARNETIGRVVSVNTAVCIPLVINTVSGITITAFHMPTVTTSTKTATTLKLGQHYDPLVPITDSQVCPEDKWIWLDIAAAKTATPGMSVMQVGDMTVGLSVLNFTLPDRPSMPLYVGVEAMKILKAQGVSSSASTSVVGPPIMQYVQMLRAHRLESYGQAIAPIPVGASGALNLDQFAPFSYRGMYLAGAIAPPVLLEHPNVAPTAAWLQAAAVSLASEPTLVGAWSYTLDEPQVAQYSDLTARLQAMQTTTPSLKRMVTIQPTTQFFGLVNNFCTVFEQFDTAKVQPGTWLYGSCMSHGCGTNTLTGTPDLMLDEPNIGARAFPVVAYAVGAQAALYYDSTYEFGLGDPWTTQYQFGGNGDGTLFYPGVVGQHGVTIAGPVSSIRLKQLRQGMNDIEYLKAANLTASVVQGVKLWDSNQASWEALRSQAAIILK